MMKFEQWEAHKMYKELKRQRLGFQAELILRQKQGYQGIALNILQNKINKIVKYIYLIF